MLNVACEDVDAQSGNGGRKRNPKVGLEFIVHFHLLTACRGNGGVADKRQVVAKKRAAQHHRHKESRVDTSALSQLARKRRECHDSAHRSANRHGYEACCDEKPRHKKRRRQRR